MGPAQLDSCLNPADGSLVDEVPSSVEAVDGAQQQNVLVTLYSRAIIQQIRDRDRRSFGDEARAHRLPPALVVLRPRP
jgi:hypothetical protein